MKNTERVIVPVMIEGEDFYLEKDKIIFTKKFLLKRGKCCHHGCRNCPWKKSKKVDKGNKQIYTDKNKV